MATNTHDNLNSQQIPQEWRLYHPVSGDEITIANTGLLSSYMARQYWLDSGWMLDDTIFLEIEDEANDGQ